MTELSPQAQAVLKAFLSSPEEADVEGALAAALRAVALYCKRDRLQLFAIAAELEDSAK